MNSRSHHQSRSGEEIDRFVTRSRSARRLVASICSHGGVGKTTFAMTCPGPLWSFVADANFDEIAEQSGREDIYPIYFRAPISIFGRVGGESADDIKEKAAPVWYRFTETIRKFLDGRLGDGTGTIIFDTGSEFRQIQLLAWFGKTIQIPKELYTPVNRQWQDIFNAFKGTPYHVVILHRLKDHYKNERVRTRDGEKIEGVKIDGVYDRDGFNRMEYLVQVEAFLHRDIERDPDIEEQFGLKIMKCTQRASLLGEEYWGVWGRQRLRVCSFPFLAAQVYPDTRPDDWS